jgi:hypothetical protein
MQSSAALRMGRLEGATVEGKPHCVTIDTHRGEGLTFDLGCSKLRLRFRPHRGKLVVNWEQIGESLVVTKTQDVVEYPHGKTSLDSPSD